MVNSDPACDYVTAIGVCILSYELRINECLLFAFLSAKHKSLCPRHELGCYEMHGGCYFVVVVKLGSKLIVFSGCFTMLW